jgi:hypothetical protein
MVYGQGEFSLYTLNRTVPQAHQINPAFFSDAKVVVGLPILSSTRMGMDLGQISFNNLFTEQGEGAFSLDFDKISGKLNENNNLSVNSDVGLFFFGLNFNKNYVSLAVNERISSWMVYTKDIADMLIYGNGDPSIFGRNIELGGLSLNQSVYHEIALGYSRIVNDKLSLGARFKLLYGVLNAETDNLNGFIRTDADSIHITNSSFSFRHSGYSLFDGDVDMMSMAMNTMPFSNSNTGYGIDLGAQYQITDRMHVSASLIDLGYIDWKDNTESIGFNDVTYSFTGFDLLDLIDNSDSGNDDVFQQELDSLESLYTVNETEGVAYRSSLVSNFYTAFDYRVGEKHHFGAQVYGRIANGTISPEFGAYYNLQLGRVLNAVINASFRNGKVSSVGAGMSVNLGPVQFYGTTEGASSWINPEAASMVDARVGLNLTFGRKKRARNEEIRIAEEQEEIQLETEELQVEDPTDDGSALAAGAVLTTGVAVAGAEEMQAAEPVAEPPAMLSEPEPEAEPEPVMEEAVVMEAPEVVVRQGVHEDELQLGHYVVVGAFLSKGNASEYSQKLKALGYNNQFGFLTEKDFYYVTVYNNKGNIEAARKVRSEYRSMDLFEFPNAWLLSVVE